MKLKIPSTFDKGITIPGLSIIFFIAFCCMLVPGISGHYLNIARQWITGTWGWAFIFGASLFILFLLLLCLSRLGDIRLGDEDEEPEYPFLSWVSMLFAAGMGIGLLYFGVAEPISHYALPLREGLSAGEQAKTAMLNTFFHWGIHAWAIYGTMGLALAYFGFRYHLPLTIRSAFYPLLKGNMNGTASHLIDIIALCCTIFGITTTLGYGAMQLGAGLKHVGLLGQLTQFALAVIILAATSCSILSAISGVGKGVRRLSEANLALAGLLLLFILLAGPTTRIMGDFTENVGAYIHNLVPMSFRTFAYDPENEGWFTDWTVMYWAWWISWAPFVGMFIAKISKGRTIREFIMGVLFVPTLFNLLWMTIFGNSAILLDQESAGALSALAGQTEALLFAFLSLEPLGQFTSAISVLMIFIFFVTSADSGIFVINTIASHGEHAFPRWQSIFWGYLMSLLAIGLLYSGGLSALQSMTMITALPFLFIMLLLCFCLWKGLMADEDYFSRNMSVYTSYWTGSAWKQRLSIMSSEPDLASTLDFMKNTALPALEELKAEMESHGIHPSIEEKTVHGLPRYEFTIHQSGLHDFTYGIMCEIREASDTAVKNKAMPFVKKHKIYIPASYFEDGRTGYSLRLMKKEELIVDILRQYDRFTRLASDKNHKLFIFEFDES